MKKLFAAAIAIMCCATVAIVGASSAFCTMEEDGFAVPKDAGIQRALAAGEGEAISLVEVNYGDAVYSSLTGYYVGEDREKIDVNFPLYTNGGNGLRFLNDENWLITTDTDLYQTFEGLYLREGLSYNSDMSRADEGEFILLSVSGGLYMNAQQAEFCNALGDTVIPMGSILSLTEDSISWYAYNNGSLAYTKEEAVFDATIKFGEHEYAYIDLLDALGLIGDVIENSDSPSREAEELQKAGAILNGKEESEVKKDASSDKNIKEKEETDKVAPADEEEGKEEEKESEKEEENEEEKEPEKEEEKEPEKIDKEDPGQKDDDNKGEAATGQEPAEKAPDTATNGGGSQDNGESDNKDIDNNKPNDSGSADDSNKGESGGGGGGDAGGGSQDNGKSDNEDIDDNKPDDSGSADDSNKGDSSGGGEGGNGGDSKADEPEYTVPEVSLTSIELWSYGLGLDVEVKDPSGVIVRGVNFTVFKALKGSGGSTVNEAGYTVYPSETYDGKSTALRKNKASSSQAFVLSTLQPGQTIYLQYNFRYNEESKDAEGNQVFTRKYYYSDLIELKLPSIEEGNLKAISVDWNVEFAGEADAVKLNNIKIANTSDYDPDLIGYNFENFKRNTIPYLNRLELTLTPEGGGEAKTVVIGSSTLSKAQKSSLAGYTSSSPKLESNKKYTCRVVAKDRYGNQLPLEAENCEAQAVYTRKQAPTVTITEMENIMDKLALKIEVSDPDKALTQGESLKLRIADSKQGNAAGLYGKWDTEKISQGGEEVYELELKKPEDGSEYSLEVESLAFSCLYTVEVAGNFDAQPDGVEKTEETTVPAATNAQLGKLSVYTSPLTDGIVAFNSGVDNLMDTSVTLQATMTSESTIGILPLIDEFRIILKDKSGKEINTTRLDRELLETGEYKYNQDKAAVVIEEGNDVKPEVLLYGTRDKYLRDPWESFLIHEVAAEEAGEGYSKPLQLRISMPKGSLSNFTGYSFTIQAVVKKSGQEYLIPVSMTNSTFTTKKTIPEIQYSDLFLAADVAEFIDLKIYDPDGTIQNGGAVTAQLYYGNVLIRAERLNAVSGEDAEGKSLRFNGLITGGRYTLKFVADAYNDAEGYGSYRTNYLLETYELIGGSAIYGSIDIQNLQKETAAEGEEASCTATIKITAEDTKGYLGREGEKAELTLTIEQSKSMEIPSYEPYRTMTLPMTKNDDGTLSLDRTEVLEGLAEKDAFRVTLTAVYQGSEVQLSQTTFRTDADYVMVATHQELVNALTQNSYANILVTADFEQNVNAYYTVNGSIDFQGHTVTKAKNITNYFLNVGSGGKVKNLVYEYPREAYYVNPKAIFYRITGTVDNLVINTNGQVEVNSSEGSLVANSVSAGGVLSNFILHAGGDIIGNTAGASIGVLASGLSGGTIEKGYIYADGGAGFVARGYGGYVGLIYRILYGGTIRNVYVLMDSWYEDGSTTALIVSEQILAGNVSNIYTVGDFYKVGKNENKTYLLPLEAIKTLNVNTTKAAASNVWTLTSREYKNQTVAKLGDIANLYDVAWQGKVLTEGFDVEGCVSMGFYPRLMLSDEMQKYQEYIPLPTLSDSQIPNLVEDGWATEEPYNSHDLAKGYIKLRFENTANLKINSVSIDGLITEVLTQGAAADGLYDVILNAEVDLSNPQYLSSYKVTEIGYTAGTVKKTTKSDYTTSRISFWKEVATLQDWTNINSKMSWNYKLTKDIDFGTGQPHQIVINGSTTNFTSGYAFTGKIDGQEHILKGIELKNMKNTYVFYSLSGAEISNLFIEDMTITAADSLNISGAGFFRYMTSSEVTNVRIRNSSICGSGNIGMLVGQTLQGVIEYCSASGCTLTDAGLDYQMYAGGLAGHDTRTSIGHCYTHDMTMEIIRTNVVNGIGGLAGYAAANNTEDCYTHGYIRAAGNNVGGIIGDCTTGDRTDMRRCVSYVDILQTAGDYAGGLWGSMYDIQNSVAIGDVNGAGTNTNRIAGKGSSNRIRVYAYKGQQVTGLTENDLGNANGLLSGDALGSAETWMDDIRLGSGWDYSSVEEGCMPLLNNDCTREGWTQAHIPLPGQAGDPSLEILGAEYASGRYMLTARLLHPKVPGEYIKEHLKIEFDGMDISDSAVMDGKATVMVESSGDSQETRISITTNGFTKALDSYALKLSYTENNGRQRQLTSMIQYLNQDGSLHLNYWEISDLDTWNSVVKDHGNTGENIKITGLIDFGKKPTGFNELEFNRMEGSGENSGFKNLVYDSGVKGSPWITKVGLLMTDLTFENMKFEFSQVNSYRTMTAPIISAAQVSNVELKDIKIFANKNTRNYSGFFSVISGSVDNIKISGFSIEDKSADGSQRSYCGALAGYTSGDISRVVAKNVTIDMPFTQYTGGIVGSQQTYGKKLTDCSIEDFSIVGGEIYVGGLAGLAYPCPGTGNKASDGKVKGANGVGGLYGRMQKTGAFTNDIEVSYVEVTATKGYAGGMTGSTFHIDLNGGIVKNCIVKGVNYAGGLCGYPNGTLRIYNLQVIGCTIESTSTSLGGTGCAAGGVIGAQTETKQAVAYYGIAVRDCTIESQENAGGFIGLLKYSMAGLGSDRIYVAEDVTVTARKSAAGGLIGYTNILTLSNSACGATVYASNNTAGGLIGHVEPQNSTIMGTLQKLYYKGKVSAGNDYAAGLIGKINSGTLKTTDSNMKGLLSAADVRCSGENVSLWINDSASTGDAGTGYIYVWEDSLINGQTAKSLLRMAESENKTTYVLPKRTDNKSLRVATSELKDKDFYKDKLLFGDSEWDYSGLTATASDTDTSGSAGTGTDASGTKYMPYTKNYDEKEVLEYAYQDAEGNAAGIRVPGSGDTTSTPAVYPSGVNTVNIELALADDATFATVTINSRNYGTDENGVITLNYDFGSDSDLTVNGEDVKISSDAICRKVMTYGNYWYYIANDGLVHYGNATGTSKDDMKESGTVDGVTGALHLWQGKVMASDGKCYSLDGGSASLVDTETVDSTKNLTQLVDSDGNITTRPIWQDGNRSIYYNFSLYNEAKVPYRVFMLDGDPYLVSASQKVMADGMILSKKNEFANTIKYFALLDEKSGQISAYLSDMKLGSMTNSGIKHISNNLGYDGTLLLAYYGDGKVVGVDYTTGDEIVSTLTKVQSFTLYARRAVRTLAMFRSAGVLAAGSDFADGENLQNSLGENIASGTGNGAGNNLNTGNATSSAGTSNAAGNSDMTGTSNANGTSNAAGTSNMAGTSNAAGTSNMAGTSNLDGNSNAAGSSVDASGSASDGISANSGASASSGAAGGSSTGSTGDSAGIAAAGSGSASAGGSGEISGSASTGISANSSASASPGTASSSSTGSTGDSAGIAAAGSGSASAGSKENTGTAGSRVNASSEGASKSGEIAEGEAKAYADTNSGDKLAGQEAAFELLGKSVVAFSEKTGKYELLDTASLLKGKEVTRVDALAAEKAKEAASEGSGTKADSKQDTDTKEADDRTEKAEKDGEFSVAWGLNHNLYTGEKQGFILIGLATAVAIAVLTVLYLKIIRKRRR